jgi:hypothetical protein
MSAEMILQATDLVGTGALIAAGAALPALLAVLVVAEQAGAVRRALAPSRVAGRSPAPAARRISRRRLAARLPRPLRLR